MAEHLYLDAPSLAYRAFFALPKTLTDSRGRSVNAVRGFMDMTRYLVTERRPAEVIAVFDSNYRPDFRVAAYPPYKAHRPDDPPELPYQFDILAAVLDAAGIRWVEAPGLEADDALATIVDDVPAGERYVIVSGDRDLLSLVRDPDVVVLFPVRGVKEMREYDEAAVEAKYGVAPRLYAEFATLRGDPSDGLPGVEGIGPVRAAKLLATYGSTDGILEHLDELPDKQRSAFDAARGYLDAMKTVVPLRRDAPLDGTDRHAPDETAMRELADEYALGSSATRLLRALDGMQGA